MALLAVASVGLVGAGMLAVAAAPGCDGCGSLQAAAPLAVQANPATPQSPHGPLNTLADVRAAIRGCWAWPPLDEIRDGMDITVLLSFRRDGEIYGAKVTYESQLVSPRERDLYHRALMEAVLRCSPLPLSETLGNAIAGRPMIFRFNDNRRQRKADSHG